MPLPGAGTTGCLKGHMLPLHVARDSARPARYSAILERINYYAFVAFLAAFFLFEKNALNKMFYLNMALLAAFMCWDRRALQQALKSRVFQSVLVFAAYLLVRTLCSDNFNPDAFFRDFKASIRILFFLLAVGFLMHEEHRRTYALYAVVCAALIGGTIALVDYFDAGFYLHNKPLGGDTNFKHHIYLGGTFAAVSLILNYLLGSDALHKRSLKVTGVAAFIFTTFLVYMSQSRSAILGFLLTFVFCSLLFSKNRIKYLCSLLVVGAVFVIIGNQYFFDAATLISRKDASRFEIWDIAFERFLEAPVFGGGLSADLTIQLGDRILAKPHSLYLSIGLVGGLVAIVLFLMVWFFSARAIWRQRSNRCSRLVLPLALFALWFHVFDSLAVFDKPTVDWLILWMPIGLSMALEYNCPNNSGSCRTKTDTVSGVA